MFKILVIDDEENIRLLYKEEFEEEGYEVKVASSSEEAKEVLKEYKPDIITLDIKMSGSDGIEFLRKLRETDRKVPVIISSAYSSFKQDFQVWASDAYVVKSANLEELKITVKDILENKK